MKKAFTLVELLIVIAIIAILTAMFIPAFAKAQCRNAQWQHYQSCPTCKKAHNE